MSALADPAGDLLDTAINGDHREAENVARDQYRHPKETLLFMGWQPDMTVVEIWPGKGWYTEILAPITRPQGILYVAGFGVTSDRAPDWRAQMQKEFNDKLEQRPDIYNHVVVTELSVPERTTIAPPGTADMVLTFRNVHNWMKGGYAEQMFEIFARTLKPGGILGITEHRAKPGTLVTDMIKSGYVTEEHVITLAQEAGFKLVDKSEINANPKDTADHPAGVWTLPPSLRYCKNLEGDAAKSECMEKYRAIGESDRMTLKFVKQ
ncbi:MAG: methyltransferase [Gammaproteobacteria bacterium]|nr:methyltransferase [Gammaproteobacteria bacterium]